jgi:hypothetical protein
MAAGSAAILTTFNIAMSRADGPGASPIVVVGGGFGVVDTSVTVPGSPGKTAYAPASGAGVSTGPTCSYVVDGSNLGAHPKDYPGLATADFTKGTYYYRYCPDGTASFVWVPKLGTGVPAGVPAVTPALLAQEASDRLALSRPTIRRSPSEGLRYHGDPYTWVNLWTWFWTDPASYRALTQTVQVGGVFATVTAKPVGLLLDPGEGSIPVRCDGPGRAWTEADGNSPPLSGCGFSYSHVTDGTVLTRVAILWRVSWSGSGGAGGVLPQLRTEVTAPLRVLQAQVVNR